MTRARHNAIRAALLLAAMLAAPAASAQILRVTSAGNATLAGNLGGGVTVQSASNAALATVVNFGDVGPANASNYVCFTQPLALRSDVQISLRLAVTAEAFAAPAGAVKKSDIGLGLINLRTGGPLATIANITMTPAFTADPCAAPKNADGIPTYSATLATLPTAAPGTAVLQSTGAISFLPALNLGANRVLVDLRMAIAPQFYNAGNFSATVTVTITSP
jgi:hypothetical protein